jgi:hypothetical protein
MALLEIVIEHIKKVAYIQEQMDLHMTAMNDYEIRIVKNAHFGTFVTAAVQVKV